MAIRGTSNQEEIKTTRRRKDTRRFGQKFSDFMGSMDNIVFMLLMFGIAGIAVTFFFSVPGLMEIMLITLVLLNIQFLNFKKNVYDFPYRVPMHADLLDGSTQKGKEKGKGVTYLGNENNTKNQIYISDSDIRTHMLVLGTTGSGKTEFLLGLCANALVQNSGYIYVDGKGDVKLQKDMFRLARNLGREDDLLLINFMTSGRDFTTKQPDKTTNNMNLMANASSGMLVELIVGLMDDSSGSGGDMWKGRAIAFISALTRPLVYLRDMGRIDLSAQTFIDYLEFNKLEEFIDQATKEGGQFKYVSQALIAYVRNVPGYNEKNKGKQDQKTLEQHGFISMQLTRVFNDLSFNYGHIFNTPVGEIDFYDVVLNRRILVVLLPALELAPDSLRMLGKLIVGNIKQLMAGCLGNKVEGLIREIIESRPTNAKTAFYCILDEYGYYSVLGFAVAPAQARSLGFSITFAAQDFSSLKKSSAEEADATWENTNVRIVGRITSGSKSETWERIHGAAGEADVAQTTAFNRKMGMADEKFTQTDSVAIERRSRIDYDDFAGQQDGEMTFIVGKKVNKGADNKVAVIRGRGFYTAGPTPKEMRLNDFIPIISYKPTELPKFDSFRREMLNTIKTDDGFQKILNTDYQPNHTVDNIAKIFQICSAKINDLPVANIEETVQLALNVYVKQERYVENTFNEIAIVPISQKIKEVDSSKFTSIFGGDAAVSSLIKELKEKQTPAVQVPSQAVAVNKPAEDDFLDTTQSAQNPETVSQVVEDNPEVNANQADYSIPNTINLADPIVLSNNTIEQFLQSEFESQSLFKPFTDDKSLLVSSNGLATVQDGTFMNQIIEGALQSAEKQKEAGEKTHQQITDIVRKSTTYQPSTILTNQPEIRSIDDINAKVRSLSQLAEIAKQQNLKSI